MSARRRRKHKRRTSPRAKLIAFLIILVCFLVFFFIHRSNVKKERAVVEKGVAFLNSIDSEDALAATEKAIKEQRQDAITKLLSEAAAEGGESSFDPWGYFNDSVIMGDSRAVGFYVFEYLPESRVLAAAGNTIQTIDDHLDDLKALNPSYVFLCYGLNDITSGRWSSAEDWIKDYKSYYKKLNEMFPDTTFVINSILPTTDKATATSDRVKLVPEYAEALEKFCEENSILFVDCDQLAENHQDMVDVDGIHYMRTFYPYWAAEMIVTAYISDEDDPTAAGAEAGDDTAQETEGTEETQ